MGTNRAKNGGFHSWYDGFVYDKLFTPLTTWQMHYISGVIPDKSTVLEVGCGPGSLSLKLSGKCAHVTGIDLSDKMIAYAMKRKEKEGLANVDFLCVDAAGLAKELDRRFNYAIACMCFHEMSYQTRLEVARNCSTLAERIIISDYVSPFPRNLLGRVQTFVEACAGKRHYNNFKEWQKLGGLDGFVKLMGLKVHADKPWNDGIGKIVIAS